jgi:hypothetical protein
MELNQRKRLERARLQYENLLNNSNWDADNGATALNKENFDESNQNSDTDDILYYHDRSKLEVASSHYNANFAGGNKHREGCGKAGVSHENFPASGLAPPYSYGNKSVGKLRSSIDCSVNGDHFESRYGTNTSIRNRENNHNNDSVLKSRTKALEVGFGTKEKISSTSTAESFHLTSQAFATYGNAVEDNLPMQGASDDPFWDDRSTLIVKLQASLLICRQWVFVTDSTCPCLDYVVQYIFEKSR